MALARTVPPEVTAAVDDDDDDGEITIERRVRVVAREVPRPRRRLLRRSVREEDLEDFVEVRDSWLLPGPL
jgi:hypothetical protein